MKKTKNLISKGSETPGTTMLKAMMVFLPVASHATEFMVTTSGDDGTGLTNNTLSWAIFQANTNPGPDFITLSTDVSINGVMKRLVDSDITIQSDLVSRVIDGNNLFRPLFIKSGQVAIKNITFTRGLAIGGTGPGAGSGMGGALFLYDGDVNISDSTFEYSQAQGGQETLNSIDYFDGGGGMLGNNAGNVGGGLLGTGGQIFGQYQNNDPRFGVGATNLSVNGGFGGGGAGNGAYVTGNATHGGFGGGGGSCYCAYGGSAGKGGFGGAGGNNYYSGPAASGFGASGGNGAGLGGAVFVRSGSLDLARVSITSNMATANGSASGLGGGIFVLHTLTSINGNNQGMPSTLPEVTACELNLINNTSASDPDAINNNDDVYDTANLINSDTGQLFDAECNTDLIFSDAFEG